MGIRLLLGALQCWQAPYIAVGSKLGKRHHVNVHAATPTRVVHSLPMQAVGYMSQ